MGAIFLQGLGTGLPGSKGQDMLTKSPPAALNGSLDDVGLMAMMCMLCALVLTLWAAKNSSKTGEAKEKM